MASRAISMQYARSNRERIQASVKLNNIERAVSARVGQRAARSRDLSLKLSRGLVISRPNPGPSQPSVGISRILMLDLSSLCRVTMHNEIIYSLYTIVK